MCRRYADRDPKKFKRIGHPLAVFIALGTTFLLYVVQMLYVAPQFLNEQVYKLYCILFVFIVYNILANMLACYRTTSSVASLSRDRKVPVPGEEHLWRYCDSCHKMAPPRSWHCTLCECCILKRDHHCIFTASCIGHNNHRYFFWFTFYTALGTSLCLASTIVLLANDCMTAPRPSILVLFDGSHFYHNLLFTFTQLAWVGTVTMFLFQIQVVYLNASYYKICNCTYNLGVRENCRIIMGQRGLWTFLSPAVKSPLPHDGTQWQIKQSK